MGFYASATYVARNKRYFFVLKAMIISAATSGWLRSILRDNSRTKPGLSFLLTASSKA